MTPPDAVERDINAQVAQLWCKPEHSHKTMDAEFALSILSLCQKIQTESRAESEAKIAELEKQAKKDWNGSIIQKQNKELFDLESKLLTERRRTLESDVVQNLIK